MELWEAGAGGKRLDTTEEGRAALEALLAVIHEHGAVEVRKDPPRGPGLRNPGEKPLIVILSCDPSASILVQE